MIGVGIYNLPKGEFAKIKNGIDLYSESVVRLLNTMPGERPYDPNFGCPLRRLLFEPNIYYISRSADYMIRYAMDRYEPRLEVLNIRTEIIPDQHYIKIFLYLKVKESQQLFDLTTNVELSVEA